MTAALTLLPQLLILAVLAEWQTSQAQTQTQAHAHAQAMPCSPLDVVIVTETVFDVKAPADHLPFSSTAPKDVQQLTSRVWDTLLAFQRQEKGTCASFALARMALVGRAAETCRLQVIRQFMAMEKLAVQQDRLLDEPSSRHRHGSSPKDVDRISCQPVDAADLPSLLAMILHDSFQTGPVLNLQEAHDLHVIYLHDSREMGSTEDAVDHNALMKGLAELEDSVAHNLSLVIAYDAASNPSLALELGDPNLADTYDDGSNFNKAQTLQRLIGSSSEAQTSLQARLLSQGIWVRTVDIGQALHIARTAVEAEAKIHIKQGRQQQLPQPWEDMSVIEMSWNTPSSRELYNLFAPPQAGILADSRLFTPATSSRDGPSQALPLFPAARTRPQRCSSDDFEQEDCQTSVESRYADDRNLPQLYRRVPIRQWDPTKPFADHVVDEAEPVILRNTVVSTWPALTRWQNLTLFREDFGLETAAKVKFNRWHGQMFDPDFSTLMSSLAVDRRLSYEVHNLTTNALFSLINGSKPSSGEESASCKTNNNHDDVDSVTCSASNNHSGVVFFKDISKAMHDKLKPDFHMYLTSDDWMYRKQFVWVSTNGTYTHLHFDQDFNFFVQLSGRKRFTMFPPSQWRQLYMFPRTHPLWHKSQVDMHQPDYEHHPEFLKTVPIIADVQPGDVLYIPPYYWHNVETISNVSISLSTLSHDDTTRLAMEEIYKMDHKFDRLKTLKGKKYALRLYLDMVVHELVGNHPNETQRFFRDILVRRFSDLVGLFEDDPDICNDAEQSPKIPTSQHVYGDCLADMMLTTPALRRLPHEMRDILMVEYVEEITAETIGIEKLYSFFKYCFQGQEYYITELGTEEHDELWEYASLPENDVYDDADYAQDTDDHGGDV